MADELRKMLTSEQVLAAIPFSRTTLFRLERDGLFPRGQAVAPHRKLWFEDEIITWQRDLQNPKSALAQALAARNVKALTQAKEARRANRLKVVT